MKSFNPSGMQEIPISKEVMLKLFAGIPSDAILVGGQALAYWVEHFKIDPIQGCPEGEEYVSRDADFLGRRAHVKLLSEIVSGIADYPSKKAMTILCGQIFLVNNDEKTYMNIDVIHRIGNMDTEAVRRRAVEASLQGIGFLVMHPLDVLVSRVENYRGIKEKQTSNGLRQVSLSIDVAKSYVAEAIERDENVAFKAIEKIAEVARSAAGTYARKNGAEIFNAIDPSDLATSIKNEIFLLRRLPKLIAEIEDAKQVESIQIDKPKR
jgi:hypothetical protein